MKVYRGLEQLKRDINRIREKGFIPSLRKGPTGVGYTLEKELGIVESNLQLGDLGLHELKAVRSNSTSLITLFTFNRGAWQMSMGDVIKRYGYADKQHKRRALYITANAHHPNSRGLLLKVKNECFELVSLDGTVIASWSFNNIASIFAQKMRQLIFVKADTRIGPKREEFWYRYAERLTDCNVLSLPQLIMESKIVLDIRAHLRSNNTVRNHGTAFRVMESELNKCYGKRETLF